MAQEKLGCRCLKERKGVLECKKGKYVLIDSRYWAGSMMNENTPEPQKWEKELKWRYNISNITLDPQWTPDYERDKRFGIVWCQNRFCSDHGGQRDWNLMEDQPCKAGFNHKGLLCGKCIEGYTLNVADLVSYCQTEIKLSK